MSEKKIKSVDPRLLNFVTLEGKIDIENLKRVFDGILFDAEKCNKGVVLAGRRFRNSTVELGKNTFPELRKITPKKVNNPKRIFRSNEN